MTNRELGRLLRRYERSRQPLPPMAGGAVATAGTRANPAADTSGGSVAFRNATYPRSQGPQTTKTYTMSTAAQPDVVTVKGTGFMGRLRMRFRADCTGNSADVTFTEDAPWNLVQNIQLQDSNGQLINITGYELYIANVCDAMYREYYNDRSLQFQMQSGATATGGTVEFWLDLPIILNERDLRGLLGNQDRATEYQLSYIIAGSGTLWATAPTVLPTLTVDIYYESYAVPFARNAAGQQQSQIPPTYGLLHYTQSAVSDVVPAPGTLQHYLKQGLGNDIRFVALIFRQGTQGGANTPRLNAHNAMTSVNAAAHNTAIQVQFGDVTQFNEDFDYRRSIMYQRYGFDFPNGVLVYDAIHDFMAGAGNEAGADYWHTANLGTTAYVQIAYGSAFTSSSANSLTLVTDSLLWRPPVVQPVVS